jgi:hypothetical protein
MAQVFVTGPVDVWVRFNGVTGSPPKFLGHGERAPNIRISPIWNQVRCDLGGDAPHDQVFAGSSASVQLDLIRHNPSTLHEMEFHGRSTNVLFNPATDYKQGKEHPGTIGSLAVGEGASYTLYLRFPYAAKATMATEGNGLVAGYRFYVAMLEPESITGGSSNPLKIGLSFNCIRSLNIGANFKNSFGAAQYGLYDHDMSELGDIN